MAEEQFAQSNSIQTGDDLTCPNCGSHRVRWVPYPKIILSVWFFLWVLFSFSGYAVSPVVFLVGIVLLVPTLIIRIGQNRRARFYNRMHCNACGTDFAVAKSEIRKGGSGT